MQFEFDDLGFFKNEISYKIWCDRYQKNNETISEHFHRVANAIANDDVEAQEFYDVLKRGLFTPAGRTMSNAGLNVGLSWNNCYMGNFVGDSFPEIFDAIKLGAMIHKIGGGNGFDFSMIRPKGTITSKFAVASGPVSFMKVFNEATKTVNQGSRRGAYMMSLSIYHPDIFDFINSKKEKGVLTFCNISTVIDDAFMEAVMADEKIHLHYPVYDAKGHIITDPEQWEISREIRARDLWENIMQSAYDSGEPGVLYYDTMNVLNNIKYLEMIIGTNPCGEFTSGIIDSDKLEGLLRVDSTRKDFMGACNLGSLYLARFVRYPFTKEARLDFDLLTTTIYSAVKMLDNIVDKNPYPADSFKDYQETFRTIGLGVTGLGDMLAMLGFPYGSRASLKVVDYLMNFIARAAYYSSSKIACAKGAFPGFDAEKFGKEGFLEKIFESEPDFIDKVRVSGIRNARLLSMAPAGTISIAYGNNCSSGIEPIFALQQNREIRIGGQDDEYKQYVTLYNSAYKQYLDSGQTLANEKEIFKTALELDVDTHIDMLAIIARNVDMSVSKTINVPEDYPYEKITKIYERAWKEGIKGCTIFRPSKTRPGIFDTKKHEGNEVPNEVSKELQRGEWKERAADTVYYQRDIYTGCGKLLLNVGWSSEEQTIQDIKIIRSGQGGCERSLQSIAVLISGILRFGGTLKAVRKALDGIGPCSSFVAKRVENKFKVKIGEPVNSLSPGKNCSDAIVKEIDKFLTEISQNEVKPVTNSPEVKKGLTQVEKQSIDNFGQVDFIKNTGKCPVCGDKIVAQGGCFSCSSCGYNKCE